MPQRPSPKNTNVGAILYEQDKLIKEKLELKKKMALEQNKQN